MYRRVSEDQFQIEAGDLRPNGSTLDEPKMNELWNQWDGKTFESFNFMSTSLSKDPDKSFSTDRYAILLHITIPKGTQAAYVGDISKYPDQLELLIQKGYEYRYDSAKMINDKGKESLQIDVSLVKK